MPWEAIIPAAANVFSGLLGRRGQQETNRQNLQIAREQMAFQERMSSTAYQRATKDLEKAGLNRILALGMPASSPSGALATMQNPEAALQEGVESGVNSALAGRRLKEELQVLKENAKQLRSAGRKAHYESEFARQQAMIRRNDRIISDRLLEIDKRFYDGQFGEIIRGMQIVPGSAGIGTAAIGASALGVRGLTKLLSKPKPKITDIVKHGPHLTRKIQR